MLKQQFYKSGNILLNDVFTRVPLIAIMTSCVYCIPKSQRVNITNGLNIYHNHPKWSDRQI